MGKIPVQNFLHRNLAEFNVQTLPRKFKFSPNYTSIESFAFGMESKQFQAQMNKLSRTTVHES
jgi:hypothetical protein